MSAEPETTHFLAKHTAEIIGGVIVLLLGFYTKLQGRKKAPVYLDEGEIALLIENSQLHMEVRFTKRLQDHEDHIVTRLLREWPTK